MPNHVITKLRIADLGGADLTDVHATLLNDDRQVDFCVIAEMPECLKDFSPHMGVLNKAQLALGLLQEPSGSGDISDLTKSLSFSNCMRDATRPTPAEEIPLVIRAMSNFAECGFMYWYDWSVENWGTKWNAYQQPEDGFAKDALEFEFQTAWSHPENLMKKVSERCDGVRFEIQYADEDLGSNCGSYTILNGKVLSPNIAPSWNDQTDEQKAEFTKLSFGIHYGDEDPASHGYDENWQYSDDVYDAYEAAQ